MLRVKSEDIAKKLVKNRAQVLGKLVVKANRDKQEDRHLAQLTALLKVLGCKQK